MQRKICNVCRTTFFADADWKKICLECWKRSKGIHSRSKQEPPPAWKPPPQPPPSAIPAEMLKRLIYLCHPDKHNNSQASHLATDWLLKQRDP